MAPAVEATSKVHLAVDMERSRRYGNKQDIWEGAGDIGGSRRYRQEQEIWEGAGDIERYREEQQQDVA